MLTSRQSLCLSRFASAVCRRNKPSEINLASNKGSCGVVVQQRRPLVSSGIDVEHGRGQWKTYGNVDKYKPGKFQIMTRNKVSIVAHVVSLSSLWLLGRNQSRR